MLNKARLTYVFAWLLMAVCESYELDPEVAVIVSLSGKEKTLLYTPICTTCKGEQDVCRNQTQKVVIPKTLPKKAKPLRSDAKLDEDVVDNVESDYYKPNNTQGQPMLDFAQHPPNGASKKTCGSDVNGVLASRQMAARDLDAVNRYKKIILDVSVKNFVPPELIAGIASRESRGGRVLKDEWGYNGLHFGIMQIHKRWHNVVESRRGHFNQAAEILSDYRRQVAAKHGDWSDMQTWQGAVAAYNFGVKNVWTWAGIDRGTTGNDYSHDVMARAIYFRENGYSVFG